MALKVKAGPCRHCGRVRRYAARRLCWRCYADPAVRPLHPRDPRGAPAGRPRRDRPPKGFRREPTEAELDALIAERLRDPPDWFAREAERRRRRESPPPMTVLRLLCRGGRRGPSVLGSVC